jgi:hypothetical protein
MAAVTRMYFRKKQQHPALPVPFGAGMDIFRFKVLCLLRILDEGTLNNTF